MTTISEHNPFVGDSGHVFKFIFHKTSGGLLDISTATKLTVLFQKPDTTVVERTAQLSTDGKDGASEYTDISTDLDQAGTWKIQGYAEGPFGSFHGDPIINLKVLQKLFMKV